MKGTQIAPASAECFVHNLKIKDITNREVYFLTVFKRTTWLYPLECILKPQHFPKTSIDRTKWTKKILFDFSNYSK